MSYTTSPDINQKKKKMYKEFQALIATIRSLRSTQGCPWDKRQSSISLLKYLRSECEELHEAINKNDTINICEELGDLLYILIMISEINKDLGNFELSDVLRTVNEKLIRRHPHVFAGQPYENEDQLAIQWQAIKDEEKKNNIV